MKRIAQLRQKEWLKIEAKATQRYIVEILGLEPNFSNTESKIPHSNPITIITKGAIVLLIALLVFTGFKSVDPALQFADGFAHVKDISPHLFTAFQIVSVIVNVLITTTGLLFTTIKATEQDTIEAMRRNPFQWGRAWRLEVLTPRLWTLLTYLVVVYLFIVSSRGDGDYFMKYLPVVLEVVLAHTVVDVIQNIRERRKTIHEVLEKRHNEWQAKLDNRYGEAKFLTILFQEMREALTLLRRNFSKPNAWLDSADAQTVLAAITGEYKRLTAGLEFAANITQNEVKREVKAQKVNSLAPSATVKEVKNRIPPEGASSWTVETLKQDFMLRDDITPDTDYPESRLNAEYKNGHGARGAFRGRDGKQGARTYFKGGKQ